MFRLKRAEKSKLTGYQFSLFILYTLALVAVVVLVHEAAHIITALALGVPFGELKLGFLGINPSVNLPKWLSRTEMTAIHYSGGITAGILLLLLYLLCWVRTYRRSPTFFYWALGLVTVVLAGMQLANGYIEGRYHGAYIVSSSSLISPTNFLVFGWAISAFFFHLALCPTKKIRAKDAKADIINSS